MEIKYISNRYTYTLHFMKDEPDKVVLIGWNTWIDGGAFSCAGSIEKDHIEWNNTYNQYIEPEAEDYYNRVIKLKAFL